MPPLSTLNALAAAEARATFLACCHATLWADRMVARRPFGDAADLFAAAAEIWAELGAQDYLEAFAGHPRIGDLASLRARYAGTAAWAAGEQAGADGADDRTLQDLAAGNRAYENRFGHLFIVCATGKTAAEMLALLRARMGNDPDTELAVAAAEQARITRLRLEKWLAARE